MMIQPQGVHWYPIEQKIQKFSFLLIFDCIILLHSYEVRLNRENTGYGEIKKTKYFEFLPGRQMS